MFSLNAANQAGPKSGQLSATLDQRQGLKIACLKEIARRDRFINAGQFEQLAQPLAANGYGPTMLRLLTKGTQS